MTKAEKEYLNRVQALGCMAGAPMGSDIICGLPAEIHHITTGMGMGQRAGHYEVIPLCPDHHRNGGYGFAIHAGQGTWESVYGSELDHLKETKRRLNDDKRHDI